MDNIVVERNWHFNRESEKKKNRMNDWGESEISKINNWFFKSQYGYQQNNQNDYTHSSNPKSNMNQIRK